jgi:anti-sigma factor RsiW
LKAQILPLGSEEHLAVQALLPWFVNGTLRGAEALRVEAHLGECERCRADAAAQPRLRELQGELEPAGDVERGWALLRDRLEPRVEARQPSRGPSSGRRWPRWLPLAFGLQSALALVLATALFVATRPAAPYRALGASTGAADANALVVFRADATEAQVRSALRACGARIVGGPTVTDAYLLHVADLGPEALARLRTQAAIARIESLEAGGSK